MKLDNYKLIGAKDDGSLPPKVEAKILETIQRASAGAVYVKFFGEDGIGETPSRLVSKMDDPNYAVVHVPGATYEERAFHIGGLGYLGYAFPGEASDPHSDDSEVLIRWKSNPDFEVHGPTIWFRMTARDGYFLQYRTAASNGRAVIGVHSDGTESYLRDIRTPKIEMNSWNLTRARVYGTRLSIKTWADGQPEPSDWQATIDDPNRPTGWTGFGKTYDLGSRVYLDWVVQASGGRVAPYPGQS